jgi:TPR repeat protein
MAYYQVPATGAELIRDAEAGNPDAQVVLGSYYMDGLNGFRKDPQQGIRWWEKAAEQGDHLALYNLAECYRTGDSVKQDEYQALDLYIKAAPGMMAAAGSGNPASQQSLAYMYAGGYGVTVDDAKSVYWFQKYLETNNDEEVRGIVDYSLKQGVRPASSGGSEADILKPQAPPPPKKFNPFTSVGAIGAGLICFFMFGVIGGIIGLIAGGLIVQKVVLPALEKKKEAET